MSSAKSPTDGLGSCLSSLHNVYHLCSNRDRRHLTSNARRHTAVKNHTDHNVFSLTVAVGDLVYAVTPLAQSGANPIGTRSPSPGLPLLHLHHVRGLASWFTVTLRRKIICVVRPVDIGSFCSWTYAVWFRPSA